MEEELQQESQFTYKRKVEEHSRSHCCRGKAISVTYCECVFVALFIQHVPYYIVIYGMSGCTMLPAVYHKERDFRKKKKLLNIKYMF